MADNILKNPTLTGFTSPPTVVVDGQGKQQVVEHPDDWRFVQVPDLNNDPHVIAQSLHRDRGYVIAAGWRRWEAGYQQTVVMRKGQRYVCKAVFAAHVQQPNTRVDWRFTVSINGDVEAASAWSTGPYKQEIDHLFVVEARADVTIQLTFWARSVWPDNECDFNLFSITMEKVAGDYAGDQVQYVGFEEGQPEPEPEPEPQPEPTPGDRAWMEALSPESRILVELGRVVERYGNNAYPYASSPAHLKAIGELAKLLDAVTA